MGIFTSAAIIGTAAAVPLVLRGFEALNNRAERRALERQQAIDRLNRARATLAERRSLQAREKSTRLALAIEGISGAAETNALERLLTARDRAQLGTMGVRSAPTDAEVLAAFTQLRQLTGGF